MRPPALAPTPAPADLSIAPQHAIARARRCTENPFCRKKGFLPQYAAAASVNKKVTIGTSAEEVNAMRG